ncbi:MAG: helix-turn-helix domain-containing protein [Eubacterium ramulus]
MIRYIQNNYMESISLKQLSETANICEREVQRSFHNIIQQSPIQYLIHYRIEKACHMLDSGEESIIDISNSCGFSSPSVISQKRLNHCGCT